MEYHLQESIRTKQLTNYGPVVRRTEQFIRNKFGINDSRAVIMVANATIALDVVSRAIDLLTSRDNKWATSAFTFPSSAQIKGGNSTKIVDISGDYGLDLKDPVLEKVNGLFVTNVFGNLSDIKKYEDYAKKNNKFLLFDSAATPFTHIEGSNSLNRGHGSVLSFHHTKCMGYSEGSALITTRDLEPLCRRLINFGIDNSSFSPIWEPTGVNGKMSDVPASFLLSYLEENFDFIVGHHKTLYKEFSRKLGVFGDQVKMFPNFGETPVCPCLCAVFNKKTEPLEKMFSQCNIYTRRYYNPLDPSCKNSVRLHETIICLPLHTDITFEIIDEYIEIIGNFLKEE